MKRSILSLGVMIALIAVALVGPCLACSTKVQSAPVSSCCHHNDGCQKPGKAPASERCSFTASNPATVQQISTLLLNIVGATVAPGPFMHADPGAVRGPETLRAGIPYSPPDLCILNSVLNI